MYFRSCQTETFTEKTACFTGIRTRIVRVEGEHADYLITNMAELKKYFRNPPSMIIRDLGQVYRPREQFYNFELPLTFNDRLGIGSTHLPLLQPV